MSCFRLGGGSGGCVNNQAGGEVQGGDGDCVLSQGGGEVRGGAVGGVLPGGGGGAGMQGGEEAGVQTKGAGVQQCGEGAVLAGASW